MGLDLDSWLEKVRDGNYLTEDELKLLCEYVRRAECSCMRERRVVASIMLLVHLCRCVLNSVADGGFFVAFR